MLKVGSKRRRTKNEIEVEKQEELRKQQKLEADMQELASLRDRVFQAEQQAVNNVGYANLIGQMADAGHIQEGPQNSIILNAVVGQQQFAVGGGQQEIQGDFQEDNQQPLQEEVQNQ